jgi:hypothetical protein
MRKPTKEPIPEFKTEAQERAYWESHDSSVHVDWSKAQKVKMPDSQSNSVYPMTSGRYPSAPAYTAH